MSNCIHCGAGAADYPIRVLEVQTLHIREMGGERRVQALGRFQEYTICRSCAQAHLETILAPGKRLMRRMLPFAAVLAAGVTALALGWGLHGSSKATAAFSLLSLIWALVTLVFIF